ncbi:hypothetical protein AX14_002554 [Amanita brunnescens Koide BX004]|nr:hypothetical protein AX14_002554 [Amanita brunnescens Koide BX004]
MKRYYKLHQLHEIRLHGIELRPTRHYPIGIASILVDAPMVRHLHVTGIPILDAETQEGIASGRLGPCLTSLYIEGYFSVDEGVKWFDMLESRQRKSMVAQASNWQQLVTGIRRVGLGFVDDVETFKFDERVDTLKVLGTIVVLMPHYHSPFSQYCLSLAVGSSHSETE